jgi:hypothetical protein
MLNPAEYTIYSLNFVSLETQAQVCIEQYLNRNSMDPEMWLIEKSSAASAYVTKPDQYSNA